MWALNPFRTVHRGVPALLVLLQILWAAPVLALEESRLACLLRPHAPVLSEGEAAQVENALQAALRDRQILPTTAHERDVILANEDMERCNVATCLERIARLLHVQIAIHYAITGPPTAPSMEHADGAWQLAVRLYNASVGGVGGEATLLCQRCTAKDAATQLVQLLQQTLTQDAARSRGELHIASVPSGVSVSLDGVDVGTTPYQRPAFSGDHTLVLRLAGFHPHAERVTVGTGQAVVRRILLDPGEDLSRGYLPALPPASVPRPSPRARAQRPTWRVALGGSLIGLGIAGIASGAYAFQLDGQCFEAGQLPTWVCVQGYTPGVSLTVPGVALALAGGVLLAVPAQ